GAPPAPAGGARARPPFDGARAALAATPGQLAALERAGVVDAGGRGLVAVLGALVETFTGEAAPVVAGAATRARAGTEDDPAGAEDCADDPGEGGPAFEVIYLLEAEDAAVARLRDRLDARGGSRVVVGGDGQWTVHV
ncbi:dihydroxyacetone kinase, partial [Streptomyces sp. NPDC059374]